jgi:hypothetical protein
VIWTLLESAIDYAGLFPPAQLDMPGAVAAYESYLASDDGWALGRFVVPATRLDDLASVVAAPGHVRHEGGQPARWGCRLSVVLGADLAADVDRIADYDAAHDHEQEKWWGKVEAVELRAASVDAIDTAMRIVPEEFERYVEIPITGDVAPLLRAIDAAGEAAKVRTGGTTADAFPSTADLARFIASCVAEGVRFKATAGLHHPLRGDYPLTYAPDSARGRMYGFLNVFLATAFLAAGERETLAREILEEHDPASIHFEENGVEWRGRRLSAAQLANARGGVFQSFGSCSFREPIDDLIALGIL